MAQNHVFLLSAVLLVGVKFWLAHLKALEMKMRKLILDLFLAQILPEKIYQKSLDSWMCCELYLRKLTLAHNLLNTVLTILLILQKYELMKDILKTYFQPTNISQLFEFFSYLKFSYMDTHGYGILRFCNTNCTQRITSLFRIWWAL